MNRIFGLTAALLLLSLLQIRASACDVARRERLDAYGASLRLGQDRELIEQNLELAKIGLQCAEDGDGLSIADELQGVSASYQGAANSERHLGNWVLTKKYAQLAIAAARRLQEIPGNEDRTPGDIDYAQQMIKLANAHDRSGW